jgi:hypothetical protein
MRYIIITALLMCYVSAFGQTNASDKKSVTRVVSGGGGSATLDSSLTTTTTFDYAVVIEGNEGRKAGVTTDPELGHLVVTDSSDIYNSVSKWHRVDSINSPDADEWIAVKWDTNIADETTYGISISADSTEFDFTTAGIFRVAGCAHASWNGAGGTSAAVYIRGVTDASENRCLQANFNRTNATGDQYIITFGGTIAVDVGSTFELQYQVSNVGLDFEGPAAFDNPIAFSVNFEKISK